MINIDILKNHTDCIPCLAEIWCEVLGKIWLTNSTIAQVKLWLNEWLNDDIPLALVAFCDGVPVGMCSLQINDGIRPDLKPWLGDLVIDPNYQKKGIGKSLIITAKKKAKSLGFENLYLFTFDPKIADYYTQLGWEEIGLDKHNGHLVTVMQISLKD